MIRILVFVAFIVCTHALESADNVLTRNILRRIEELEERDRIQQVEIEALRKENYRLRERDEASTVRITSLEEHSRNMVEKMEDVAARLSVCKTKEVAAQFKQSLVDDLGIDNPEHQDGFRQTERNNGTLNKVMKRVPKRQLTRTSEMNVAFFASLSNHMTHIGSNQAVLFDNVITNYGTAYNPHTGIFTAPVEGIYVFDTTLLSHQTTAEFDYAVNGKMVSRMFVYAETNTYQTTSQTAIFQLNQGDDVAIRNIFAEKMVHGGHYSSFSGFLLSTRDVGSQTVG